MILYDFFKDDTVIAGFSERSGGVSPLPENSLNLSFSREPGGNRENVLENYRIAARSLGVRTESITRMPQVHGADILCVKELHRGMGVTRPIAPELAAHGFDGMVTDVPGITLMTTHADCTPVLMFDPEKRAVAAVHSGWKGTCLKIASEAVKKLQTEYGSRPENIKAVIGPSICRDHFEVRRDVYEKFTASFAEYGEIPEGMIRKVVPEGPDNDPKWLVDMRGFVKLTLLRSGLAADNICDADICTFGRPDLFFSHRRDGAGSGAMAAFISLKE
ncbi:MAG: peptidoglycan editing factor PgeF [Clostridia bacterium]|nr:peptidoglycan editing factor PgeF [Clostridia bacterium]